MITITDFKPTFNETDICDIESGWKHNNRSNSTYYQFKVINDICPKCEDRFSNTAIYYIHDIHLNDTFARDKYGGLWKTYHTDCLIPIIKDIRINLHVEEARILYNKLRIINRTINLPKLPTDIINYITNQYLKKQIDNIR